MAAPTKIIVTGAAQGIGRAVALRLAVRDAHIAVWDTKAEGVEATAKLCREQGAMSRALSLTSATPPRSRLQLPFSSESGAGQTASSTMLVFFQERAPWTWT